MNYTTTPPPVLFVAQFFGVMPVNGVLNKDLSQMKFKWKSFRTVYAMFCCSSLLSYALITVAYNFTKQITIESFGMAISSWSYLLLIN